MYYEILFKNIECVIALLLYNTAQKDGNIDILIKIHTLFFISISTTKLYANLKIKKEKKYQNKYLVFFNTEYFVAGTHKILKKKKRGRCGH